MSKSISTLLKEKRQRTGLDLDQVSEILRIRTKYLSAIEEDSDSSDMPSPVYMLGYLKIYADFLGLNGQAIISQLKACHIELADLNMPEPYMDDNKPGKAALAISFFLILVIFVSWSTIGRKGVIDSYNPAVSMPMKAKGEADYLLSNHPSDQNKLL